MNTGNVSIRKLVVFAYIFSVFMGVVLFNGQTVKSQDFTYQKAYADYEFSKDGYNQTLTEFNRKKAEYLKNPTLSLKEELRVATYNFLLKRSDYIKSYLTALRLRVVESKGLDQTQKESVFTKIDNEVKWYEDYQKNYAESDILETLIDKSKADDSRWTKETTTAVNYTLSLISLGDVVNLRTRHEKIYRDLKTEADSLVSLGRADSSLFSRWFTDIEAEINRIKTIEEAVKTATTKLATAQETFVQKRLYEDAIKALTPAKASLLKLNNFIYELENVIQTKR